MPILLDRVLFHDHCISFCAQKFLQLEIPMHLFGWVMESRDGRYSETSLNLTDSCFKGPSLLFSENVAPSSQPENKDFIMPSSATWVRCYLRASVNCISCSIWMCPTTAWWRCPKSWISVWKLQNHLGLGFGAHVCVLVWEPKSEQFQI